MRLPKALDDLTGLRAARWVRESTRGQYDTFGPEAQRDQQDRAIERYGLVETGLSWTVAHSGRTVGDTPQFHEMLSQAGTEYDVLVVGYVSRFARDLRTAVNARHELHAAGAAILFCDERVVSSDEDSWELFAREAVEAEAYSRRLGKRIREGYAAKFRRLGDQAGNAPLGFQRDGPARTLTIDPATIGQATSLFDRYATGALSIREVAAEAGLHPDRVRAILANPTYNGWVRRYRRSGREERMPAPWRADPPVSDELWQRVQDNLYRRTSGHSPRKRRHVDPLSGLLYCTCGRRIRSNGMAGSPPRRQRLHPGGPCAKWAGGPAVFAAVHEAPIAAQIASLKLDEVTIERVVRALREGETPAPTTLDSARLEKQKRDLALSHAASELDDATYLARMAELRQTIPAKHESSGVDSASAVAFLRNIPALWSSADDEGRTELLHAIYDRIEVTRDGFARVHLTPHAFRFGLALALPETVTVDRVKARPAGFEPAA